MPLTVVLFSRFRAGSASQGECDVRTIGDRILEARADGADPIPDRKMMCGRNKSGRIVVPDVKTVRGQKSVLQSDPPVIRGEVGVVEGTQTG